MTFDNEDELYKIKEHHPSAKVVLRIRHDAKTARWSLGEKYGACSEDAVSLIKLCSEMRIELVGVAFHVGSHCEEKDIYREGIQIIKELFDLASDKYGINMNLLDIGGGFPGSRYYSISDIASSVTSAIDEYFPVGCGVDIIAEPGRYFSMAPMSLAVSIQGRRKNLLSESRTTEIQQNDFTDHSYYYYINDSIYSSMNNVATDMHIAIPKTIRNEVDEPEYECTVWGQTCCGLDKISPKVKLPLMNIGDWIYYEDMGAYTFTMGNGFNGFRARTEVYTVLSRAAWSKIETQLSLKDPSIVIKLL